LAPAQDFVMGISNFKDMHLAEWRELVSVPDALAA